MRSILNKVWYVLLLLFLIQICSFLNKNTKLALAAAAAEHQHEDSDHHHYSFHTLQITSLFPASECTTSTSTSISTTNSQASSKKQLTMDVFHGHGPCSQLNQDKSTTSTPSLREVLSFDQSRVESIHARLNPDVNIDKVKDKKKGGGQIKDKKATLPAQSGQLLRSGNYFVKVGLGSPPKYESLIFDTGSDLTWTQCQPCIRSCYQQQDTIFDPSASSTYSNLSCSSNACSLLTSATGNTPGCSTGTCVYIIQYGDSSFSVGFLVKDKLTISATDVFPNFVFGCGQNNQGLFGRTAGLLGLGRDTLSIVSQTSQKYGKTFSYCLPSTSSSTGFLSLGQNAASTNVKFTPFANSQGTSFYFIDILTISVGGRPLSISQSVFSSAGSIIDSGTVITRLPPAAYNALSSGFKQLMTKYGSTHAYSILDTCYDFSNYTSVNIPTISFTFGGNVKVDLEPTGILVAVDSSNVCLAFAGNSDASDVLIFGNTQQKTFNVVYDLAGGKLGFGAAGCK